MRDEHTFIVIGILLALLIFILLATGCVSKKTHLRELKDDRIMTMQKMRKIAYYQKCSDAVDIMSNRIELEENKN